MFNVRTYCMISCICLFLHLLDAYRTKKRKEILRLKNQAKNNLAESKFYKFYVWNLSLII